MTNKEVWSAVADLAGVWRQAPPAIAFAAVVKAASGPHAAGLARQLQEMQARYSALKSQPLRAWSYLTFFSQSGLPGDDAWISPAGEMAEFMANARRVETAAVDTVSWVRSRLPSYPVIPAPQLAFNTNLTTTEFTWRIPWQRRTLASGLQFAPAPPLSARSLDLSPLLEARFDSYASAIVAHLEESDDWARYSAALSTLSETDRDMLRGARRTLRTRLHPDEVDKYEPGRVIRRIEYRTAIVEEVVSDLSGRAREFAEAFGVVDRAIELVTYDVLGSLIVNFPIPEFEGVEDLAVSEAATGIVVEWSLTGLGALPDPGDVVFLDDPLVRDAIQLLEMNISFSQLEGEHIRMKGRLLPDSAYAWRNGSPEKPTRS